MGTDLTYGDIKDNFKFAPEDWRFTECTATQLALDSAPVSEAIERAGGMQCLAGEAASASIAEEMGYLRFVATIDPITLFPRQVRYFDVHGEPLKDVVIEQQEKIGDAWTAMAFSLNNLKTGHSTRIHLTDMQARDSLPAEVFESGELEFGYPELPNSEPPR